MINELATKPTNFSRRQIFQIGLGLATGLALEGSFPHLVSASNDPQEMLVDAESLSRVRSDPDSILVGFIPEQDFARGHIPGSVQLDWPVLEVTDTSNESIAKWQEHVGQTFTSLGITRDRPVVAYDAGTLFAARLWWVLHYLGHEDNHVINGGLTAWQKMTIETTIGATPAAMMASPAATKFQAVPRNDALAQFDEVLASVGDPGTTIVDARTPEEYGAGHIPGAVNINYPRNALAGTPRLWKPVDELRAMYKAAGITPDKRIIPYCSSGVRSAVTFFTLQVIGYQDVGLYTGSWNEWSTRPDAPRTEGDQP